MVDEPLRPTRHEQDFHALAEAFGVGRNNALWWRAVTVMAVPWAIVASCGWFYEAALKPRPPVETVFVLVDQETRVLHTAQARTWTFDDQAKADIARNWVFDLRNRSPDDYATALLRGRAYRYTAAADKDYPAFQKAETMLKEMDEKLECMERGAASCMGLATLDIQATPVGADEETNATVVRVEWDERTYKGNHTGPWQKMHMYLHVQPIEPTDTGEVMANGHGLYVVDISPVQRGRSVARVADAQ